ncbi:hypothetical protein [Streptomyces formicae]|uniref:Uncharacterized protein n=1 Tax=Streptomyces formicae TaxID=1616117 RepID=A0ABY3WW77_9ACTN|nr:hypothetical protein [Streptomyces formicae]UNM14736.1 hypothetical protein J4032_27655 [Streptomyces formicae]
MSAGRHSGPTVTTVGPEASYFRHIESLGISSGWQCWEVGAAARKARVV